MDASPRDVRRQALGGLCDRFVARHRCTGGPDNFFTDRSTTFMAWNLLHLARVLKDLAGVPAHGNVPGVALWQPRAGA
ncbi:hypothetical protein [Streptomyces sp. NPDC001315]|uniref:hypothetical protein n=1 Tax=Streptomyces sp. NPDC001315 TaxID=3364562 RepID=UPI0036A18561